MEIDHIYLGDGTTTAIPTYGMDSAYSNDAKLSDGKSLFVNGKGVKVANDPDNKSYSEASFSFTGTGFDLISRTGYNQATIRLEVIDQAGTKIKTMTVNNKGDLELYQIPIVSVQGLAHGTYTVYMGVNKAVDSPFPFLQRGDNFYLDAIRIYDTINVKASTLNKSQQSALDAYRGDREAYTYIKEIRDTLLSVTNFNDALLGNGTTGALYVDSVIDIAHENPGTTEAPEVIGDHRVVTAADYAKIGPKNEVYLSPGQAIVFKFEKDTSANPVSVDIGAKTVLGDEAELSAGFVTVTDSSALTSASNKKWTVNSATAQYYSLDESSLSTGTAVYLVIYNSHSGTDKTKNILSVTDLKVCYDKKPTRTDLPQDSLSVDVPTAKRDMQETEIDPYHFSVDSRTLEAAEVFLNGIVVNETPVEETPTLVEDLRIYHSLNLASDIAVNFMVPVEDLEGYDTFSMSLSINDYEEGYRFFEPEAVRKGEFYYFTLSDLTAVQMTDELEAIFNMTKDGKEYVSKTDYYTIATYAYGQLRNAGAPDSLKTLCADLLIYGTKAQLYKNYRTDSLADMSMTEEQRAYYTDLETVVFGNTNVTGTELEAPTVAWIGKALELKSRISVIYCVDLRQYEGSVEDLTMKVNYLDLDGTEQTVILRDPVPYDEWGICYKFTLDTLPAAELRAVLTAQIFAGDTAISNSLTYSADTYGNNKSGDLGDLCKALFAYSDSAKAFFSN